MFWGRGCYGLKSTTLRRGKKREGGGYLKSVSNCMNLKRTYFLNGPHPKLVGFIYFNENPLKMMNVRYFIWKALSIIGKHPDKKVNFKTYDVTNWNTKNYNKQISQKVKAIEAHLRLLIYKRNRRGTLIKNLRYWSLRNHLFQTTIIFTF